MTRDNHQEEMVTTPRKRSGDAISNPGSARKLRVVTSLPDELTSTPVSTSFFGGSDQLLSSPGRRSPTLPLFNNLPLRVSTSLEESEDIKPFSRGHTVDPGLAVLGEPVTKLVDLITTLRDNGIARLDIDLPQIVVVGDQSTGKSSLIEGLSAIKVPRNEGTCTRCPLEINLKAVDGPWHCRIYIVKQYGHKVPTSQENPRLGLGPWNLKFSQAMVEHFVDVSDRSEIPIYLARAQLAVLNPTKSIKSFAVPANQQLELESTQEPFSPNVIRLDISAPRLPSLSFFDLPGVIVQDKEPYVPKMIKNLVKSYISSSRSLVLLTVPMDNDRANSSSAGLIQEAGADERTIGIISKPDRLVSSNIDQWREILAGQKFKLKLGYRVVKNPADSSIDHSEARRQEREFFNTNPNFRGQLRAFSDRFGTEKLQAYLSTQLLHMIRNCLPEIEQKVNSRVAEIEKELITLPKAPEGNVIYGIQVKFQELQTHLTAAIDNTAEPRRMDGTTRYTWTSTWFQEWHKSAQAFFEKLIKTAPELDLPGLRMEAARNNGDPIIIDDDSDAGSSRTPAVRRAKPIPMAIEPSPTKSTAFSEKQQVEIDKAIAKHAQKFTLAQLRTHLHAFNGGVYGIGDPRVFESLIHDSIQHWKGLLSEFLGITLKCCERLVGRLINTVFSDLADTELLTIIKNSAKQFLAGLRNDQVAMSKRLLGIERGKPMTLDGEGQEVAKRAILTQLCDHLQKSTTAIRLQELRDADQKVNSAIETKIATQAKLETEQHHQELHELAGTIAYYRIAARRFADYNSLTIRNEIFSKLKCDLWHRIIADIGIGPGADLGVADTNLKKLMVPSPRDFQRRKDLEAELALLLSTKQDVHRVCAGDKGGNRDGDGSGMDELDEMIEGEFGDDVTW